MVHILSQLLKRESFETIKSVSSLATFYFTMPVVTEMLILSRLDLNDLLRIPLKVNLTYFSDKTVVFIRLSLVCCSFGHMIVNTVRLAASLFSKINRPIFF